ncbi:hypothetical protein SAMN06297422_10678 [Lachnospiraceae bacterium]|nr:hypothetical protein SAMN06297422_10678 [Lachnospiraceae bacterium]
MERISINIGMGIYSILKDRKISVEDAAQKIGYSIRDLRRIIEGKLFISPRALEEISEKLDISVEKLIYFQPDGNDLLPELEYNKCFTEREHLYKIVDLIDEYIELKEQMI